MKDEEGRNEAMSGPTATRLERRTVPALEQFGIGNCPICRREVAIYLARTKRPFLNCGFCSARVFFNGRESIKLLLRGMRPIKDQADEGRLANQERKEEIL